MRLDSHQHFWRYDAAQYPWIPAGSPLQRDWLPTDLAAIHGTLGFGGSIAVQARQSLAESYWLLGLADACPQVKGVVGWVDLRSPDVDSQLAPLAAHPRFVGVRHVVQDEPDEHFMLGANFQRGISALAAYRLTYDLLIYPNQLPAAIELVRRFPNQPFVLDHIAKPYIRRGEIAPWKSQMRELAGFPNVFCKVSGMLTEADHASWTEADFEPYLDTVFEQFGPHRLMFGSDWPVCLLAGGYRTVVDLADNYTKRHLRLREQEAFWGLNCSRFYLSRPVS